MKKHHAARIHQNTNLSGLSSSVPVSAANLDETSVLAFETFVTRSEQSEEVTFCDFDR